MSLSDKSLEPLINSQSRTRGTQTAHNVFVDGPRGTVTNRVVSLTDNTRSSDTPQSDVTEMHYSNNTGGTVKYGGSAVTASEGGTLYNGSTLVIKAPGPTFVIYFIQNQGDTKSLDVVEFY